MNYRIRPVDTDKMPPGIGYIVSNEAAERFSYYGMKTILVIYMTKYLLDSEGGYDVMSAEDAKYWYHLFGMAVYFFPILGAIIADAFLGKYKTILSLSLVYCLGHFALALGDTGVASAVMSPRMWLATGLTLIAIGSGGIKPCVSAHVGDQFGKRNQHLLEKVFGWFYFAINLGAFVSTLLTPFLLAKVGPSVAFGVPGILMLLATWAFWMGRKDFAHLPAQGSGFVKEVVSGEGLVAAGKLVGLYAFVAMFWALFDQTGSAWVLQAEKMDRVWLGIEWLPSQIQAINPIMIMIFIPIFTFGIYPAMGKFFKVTPLRKIAIGFFLTVPAFLLPAWIEMRIDAGETPNIVWQLMAYAIITAAEVFVSITCLEYSYTQAPKKMKSFVMGLFLMSVSMGNLFTAGVNAFIQDETVIEGIGVEGSQQVKPEGTTTYALVCRGASDEASADTRVELQSAEVALASQKKASQEGAEKEDAKAAPSVSIAHFKANGAEGRITIMTDEEVTLDWASEGADKCVIRPDGSEQSTTGQKKIKPTKTTTYVLTCSNKDGEEAEAAVKVSVTRDVRILSFTTSAAKITAGQPVTLSWKTDKANQCTLTARSITLDGPGYYLFFAMAMLITAILFVFYAMNFKEKTYIQDSDEGDANADAADGGSEGAA